MSKKIWKVTVEQIQLKPKTRIAIEMTNDELIKALRTDKGDHIIKIENLRA